jgi:hypothetical protein
VLQAEERIAAPNHPTYVCERGNTRTLITHCVTSPGSASAATGRARRGGSPASSIPDGLAPLGLRLAHREKAEALMTAPKR